MVDKKMQEEDMELLDEFAELLEQHPKYEDYEELPPLTVSQALEYSRNDAQSIQEFEHAKKTVSYIAQLSKRGLEHEIRKIAINFREEHPILYHRWQKSTLVAALMMDVQSSRLVTISSRGGEKNDD